MPGLEDQDICRLCTQNIDAIRSYQDQSTLEDKTKYVRVCYKNMG